MDTRIAEPTTVGEMLSEEFLKPLNITHQQLADVMGVSREVVGQTVNNSRRISVTEASELAGLFETDNDFWINVQAAHDHWEGRQIIASRHYRPITTFLSSAAG
jgi:putative transposase